MNTLFALPLVLSPLLAADWPKVAPYDAVRWNEDAPEVRIEGVWYDLLSVDGVPEEDVLAFARKTWPDKWRKRYGEDLPEVMGEMGRPLGERVDIVAVELASGERRELESVALTTEKRDRVRSWIDPRSVERVERRHKKRAHEKDAELVRRFEPMEARGRRLTREEAEQDLDQLEWQIEHRYSYRDLHEVDYRRALDSIRAELGEGISAESFALQLMKLVARFGDGHTRVRGKYGRFPAPHLSFLVEEADGEVLAVRPDRSDFVDTDHPVLVSIDGVPIEDALATAGSISPVGSEDFERLNARRNLAFLSWLRMEHELPTTATVTVELRPLGGGSTVTKELPVADRLVLDFAPWPPMKSGVLEGGIGYLRLPEMYGDPSELDTLLRELSALRDTEGLVVDVRGNGGGSRAALRMLFPYLRGEAGAPHVGNVAAYRLAPGDDAGRAEGFLSNRFLWPRDARVWSDDQRAAIDAIAKRFRPSWKPPAREFSDWHFLVLDDLETPPEFRYDGPVVVLQDEGCFSATDIFLGALRDLDEVTLMGTTSGGGSGRAREVTLAHSGLRVRLSSMASFRPDGSLYDGFGVAPEVVAERTAGDVLGRTDTALEAALAHLRESR